MTNNPNQPRPYDAVLGGQAAPPGTSAVQGEQEGIKQRWTLAYAHDALGNRTAGDINVLINAIRSGHKVRMLMESGDVEYVTEAEKIWIKNGVVSAQNCSQVSALFIGNKAKFQDDSYYWMIIVNTQGERDMIRWDVGAHTARGRNQDTVAMKWFVD